MERGIYFDGWCKHNHCYHPSLPLRNIQMLEDLKRYHGTVLVWAGMGGGSISLPYLREEAFGEVDPRLQFYGFMPMTNKSSASDYTCNGTKVSYRIAAPLRCVRDKS